MPPPDKAGNLKPLTGNGGARGIRTPRHPMRSTMPRGKKNSDDRTAFTTREQKIQIIRDAFPKMRHLLLRKAELQAEHIKPVSDHITKIGRNLKADTGVERADWWPDFLKYMRDQLAIDMDAQADTDRIQRNLKLMHDACASGEMVNFLDVLERAAAEPDPMLVQDGGDENADDEGETGHQSDKEETERDPAGLTFASAEREEADPMIEETAQAWAETEGGDESYDDLDQGGYTFAEGKAAGLAGTEPEANPHPAGTDSNPIWERGRIVGAKQKAAADASVAAEEAARAEEIGDSGSECVEDDADGKVVNLFQGDDDMAAGAMADLGGDRPAFPVSG